MRRFISKIIIRFLFSDLDYLRRKLLLTPVTVGPKNRVHIGKQTDLQDVIFNTHSGHIYIGDHSFCGLGCMLLTGTHNVSTFNRKRQQDHPKEGRDIHIGQGVWIASGAIICGNVKIADHAVIAAGAVVTQDCPEAALYAGIPARKIYNFHSQTEIKKHHDTTAITQN